MTEFQGVIAALATPRGNDGDVDFGAAFELVDHCCRGGVQGILLFGEEGEYAAFSSEERSRLAYLAIKRSRVPVLVGAGSPSLDVSVQLARGAGGSGAAAILIPPPYFQKCDAGDLAEFFVQFARQAGHGNALLLYNTPATTSGIAPETALGLIETGLFAGIADAGPDAEFLALADRPFELLIANDGLFPDERRARVCAISALACAVPELAVALERAIGAGAQAEVERLGALWRELCGWAARFPAQVVVKTAAALQGLNMGPLPMPLAPEKQKLLDQFREWLRSCLPAMRKLSANA